MQCRVCERILSYHGMSDERLAEIHLLNSDPDAVPDVCAMHIMMVITKARELDPEFKTRAEVRAERAAAKEAKASEGEETEAEGEEEDDEEYEDDDEEEDEEV